MSTKVQVGISSVAGLSSVFSTYAVLSLSSGRNLLQSDIQMHIRHLFQSMNIHVCSLAAATAPVAASVQVRF